jgi:hypothetical protein
MEGGQTGEATRRSSVLGRADSAAPTVWCNERPVMGDTRVMGLNPFRQHRQSFGDYLMVAVAFAVCAALVAWAFLG